MVEKQWQQFQNQVDEVIDLTDHSEQSARRRHPSSGKFHYVEYPNSAPVPNRFVPGISDRLTVPIIALLIGFIVGYLCGVVRGEGDERERWQEKEIAESVREEG